MDACHVTLQLQRKMYQLGLTETSWAIIPGAGGTQRFAEVNW